MAEIDTLPFNPYAPYQGYYPPALMQQPGLEGQRLQTNSPAMGTVPTGIAPSPFAGSPAGQRPGTLPMATPTQQYAGAAYSGLQAVQPAQPTTDTLGSLISPIMSGISGAAAGAMVAGPVGAAVGGGVGLLAGGVQSWLGLRAGRRAERKAERLRQEAQEREDRDKAQARQDFLEGRAYDRGAMALQNRAAAMDAVGNRILQLVQTNQGLRQMWVQQGYV